MYIVHGCEKHVELLTSKGVITVEHIKSMLIHLLFKWTINLVFLPLS
jgi:hypothetical protein